MNASPGTEPEQPDDDARVDPGDPVDPGHAPTTPAPPARTAPAPLLPTQSSEDTDAGWGEYRERDDDDRFLRDRPPHWDNT
jgi:hypothetical protein